MKRTVQVRVRMERNSEIRDFLRFKGEPGDVKAAWNSVMQRSDRSDDCTDPSKFHVGELTWLIPKLQYAQLPPGPPGLKLFAGSASDVNLAVKELLRRNVLTDMEISEVHVALNLLESPVESAQAKALAALLKFPPMEFHVNDLVRIMFKIPRTEENAKWAQSALRHLTPRVELNDVSPDKALKILRGWPLSRLGEPVDPFVNAARTSFFRHHMSLHKPAASSCARGLGVLHCWAPRQMAISIGRQLEVTLANPTCELYRRRTGSGKPSSIIPDGAMLPQTVADWLCGLAMGQVDTVPKSLVWWAEHYLRYDELVTKKDIKPIDPIPQEYVDEGSDGENEGCDGEADTGKDGKQETKVSDQPKSGIFISMPYSSAREFDPACISEEMARQDREFVFRPDVKSEEDIASWRNWVEEKNRKDPDGPQIRIFNDEQEGSKLGAADKVAKDASDENMKVPGWDKLTKDKQQELKAQLERLKEEKRRLKEEKRERKRKAAARRQRIQDDADAWAFSKNHVVKCMADPHVVVDMAWSLSVLNMRFQDRTDIASAKEVAVGVLLQNKDAPLRWPAYEVARDEVRFLAGDLDKMPRSTRTDLDFINAVKEVHGLPADTEIEMPRASSSTDAPTSNAATMSGSEKAAKSGCNDNSASSDVALASETENRDVSIEERAAGGGSTSSTDTAVPSGADGGGDSIGEPDGGGATSSTDAAMASGADGDASTNSADSTCEAADDAASEALRLPVTIEGKVHDVDDATALFNKALRLQLWENEKCLGSLFTGVAYSRCSELDAETKGAYFLEALEHGGVVRDAPSQVLRPRVHQFRGGPPEVD